MASEAGSIATAEETEGGAEVTVAPPAAGRSERRGLAQLKERAKHWAHAVLGPVVSALSGLGLKADHLTWLGLALGVAAGVALFDGRSRLGALLLSLGGVCGTSPGRSGRGAWGCWGRGST